MAFRNHYNPYGGCHQVYKHKWESSHQPFEETSWQENFNDQEDVFSYAYNHGVRSDPYSSWCHDYDVVQEDFHGWGMSHAYQPPPFQQEKSNLEIAMEKLAEASNQFKATSDEFNEEHAKRVESQKALHLHQFPPTKENKINLEDVYVKLDKVTNEFVAQQEMMRSPSYETSYQDILVENDNLAIESYIEDQSFEAHPPISCSHGVKEQDNNFHEVDDMKGEEQMKVSCSTGAQLVFGEESMSKNIIPSLAPALMFFKEVESSLCWKMAVTKKNNQELLNGLELHMKSWFIKMVERLEEELATMARRLKAPYTLLKPKSIMELRRQHPP